jgi:glycosyltransferase involved in cell wall biosynthesis
MEVDGDGFEVLGLPHDSLTAEALVAERLVMGVQAVVASGYVVHRWRTLQKMRVPLAADVYIPGPVESLAWNVSSDKEQRVRAYRHAWEVGIAAATHADFVVCASERQRDFWLGTLAAVGRLHPDLYAEDVDLRSLIDVVPFGCPSDRPQAGPAMKGIWPGIDARDRVILWGGGVWNWFDAATLLRAMPHIIARHPGVKLVFLGANHPDDEHVPEMEAAREARALCERMGFEGSVVFWSDWIPYADRGAYLAEADIGVSLHHQGVEPRFAFRTRLLDAIWASLPTVLTQGDLLGEELGRAGVGNLVEPNDVAGVARAVNALLDEPDARAERYEAFEQLRQRYAWARVAEPLVRFCSNPKKGVGKLEAQSLLGAESEAKREELQVQVEALRNKVQGYESGRLMRLMKRVGESLRRFGM